MSEEPIQLSDDSRATLEEKIDEIAAGLSVELSTISGRLERIERTLAEIARGLGVAT